MLCTGLLVQCEFWFNILLKASLAWILNGIFFSNVWSLIVDRTHPHPIASHAHSVELLHNVIHCYIMLHIIIAHCCPVLYFAAQCNTLLATHCCTLLLPIAAKFPLLVVLPLWPFPLPYLQGSGLPLPYMALSGLKGSIWSQALPRESLVCCTKRIKKCTTYLSVIFIWPAKLLVPALRELFSVRQGFYSFFTIFFTIVLFESGRGKGSVLQNDFQY